MADDDPITGWRLLLATWMARLLGYDRIYYGDTLLWSRDADKEERTDG